MCDGVEKPPFVSTSCYGDGPAYQQLNDKYAYKDQVYWKEILMDMLIVVGIKSREVIREQEFYDGRHEKPIENDQWQIGQQQYHHKDVRDDDSGILTALLAHAIIIGS